jgi:hypothetical protein
MPKLKTDIKDWFDYPDDKYGGKVLVRMPWDGEIDAIRERNTEYLVGSSENVFRMNKTNEEIFWAAVEGWENFLDENDEEMKCTKPNVLLMCKYSKFRTFIDQCIKELRRRYAEQLKAERKN